MNDKDTVFVVKDLNMYDSVTKMIEAQKCTQKIQVLQQGVVEANNYISKKLKVPLASKLFYLEKLRIVNDIPKSIDKIYILLDKVEQIKDKDFNDIAFYAVLKDELSLKIYSSEEEIMIVEANESEKKLLNYSEYEKDILLTKGRSFLDNHEILEYYEIVSVPSFYRFRSVSEVE